MSEIKSIDYIKIDILSKQIDIVKDSFWYVKPFKDLYTRKRTMTGDSDGRAKKLNYKEIGYVYLMAEWSDKNPLNETDEQIRDSKAREWLDMPEDWVVDALVLQCIKEYKLIQYELCLKIKTIVSARNMLLEVTATLANKAKQTKHLNKQVDALNTKLEKANINEVPAIVGMITNINQLVEANAEYGVGIIDKVEKALAKVDKMEQEAKKLYSSKALAIGSKVIGNREMPNNHDED